MAIAPNQPLHDDTVRMGLTTRFAALRDAGVDLNGQVRGETPLVWAIRHGPLEAVEALLATGVDVFTSNHEGLLPLHVAADMGKPEAIPHLLAWMLAHRRSNGGEARNICVASGAYEGWNALHFAAHRGEAEHVRVIRLLSLYPGRADDCNAQGDTPLMLAARADSAGAVNALVNDAKAAVKLRHQKTQRTALHEACALGAGKAGIALLECGADPEALLPDGSRPLHLVARLQPGMPVPRRDLAVALMNFGAEPNRINSKGETALDVARNEGNDQVCRVLKAHGAIGDGEAFTPYNP